jgi:hypothetical protein
MRKLTLLGIAALFMLLLTQAATALVPTKYNLCNKGTIEVRYATAIRSGNFLFGYSWDLVGWYPILPGKCDDAYHGSDKDPDEPIYVAIAFRDSTGVWGAATFPKPDIDTKLCVAKKEFKYHLNGNINLPCESGYFPFRAALYLEPVEWQCYREPWFHCFGGTYSFDFEVGPDSRAVAAGPAPTAAPRPDAPTAEKSLWAVVREGVEAMNAARVETLRKNVRAYIAAADTGFESYKKGAPRVVAGDRVWSAKEISLPDDSCIVSEGTTNVVLRCLEFTSSSRETIEAMYAELVKNVAAALPEDWKPYSGPDFSWVFTKDMLANKVFRSSNGLNYFIWTSYHDSEYQLGYQVLAPRRPGEGTRNAAPSKPAPNRPMTPEDDPIGDGGFITPYILPK